MPAPQAPLPLIRFEEKEKMIGNEEIKQARSLFVT